VPASQLQANDPLASMMGNVDPDTGQPMTDDTTQAAPADGTAGDAASQPDATQQPAAPPRRSPRNIGDLLKGLFGGGG
jgi:hypothetical protein